LEDIGIPIARIQKLYEGSFQKLIQILSIFKYKLKLYFENKKNIIV